MEQERILRKSILRIDWTEPAVKLWFLTRDQPWQLFELSTWSFSTAQRLLYYRLKCEGSPPTSRNFLQTFRKWWSGRCWVLVNLCQPNIVSRAFATFVQWNWILGADQKDRSLWEQDCCLPCSTLLRLVTLLPWKLQFNNRLIAWNSTFYSWVLSDLAWDWKRGWEWPCLDTNLTAFHM